MTSVGSFATEDERLMDVVSTMRANNHSCAVITAHGAVKGILTERDLVIAFSHVLRAGVVEDVPVSAVMTPDPVCVSEDASLLDALTLARANRVRHLPVINNEGVLVGMVTHTDMVNLYVDILEEQSALIDANTELRAQSREDPLLQIGNRRAMESDMAKVAATAQRSRQCYAIALLDLDYFKPFNDHYGHVEGDHALQTVVSAIKNTMRQGDTLYRYGGEELLMLMPGSDITDASHAAERARQAVQHLDLLHQLSPYGSLTISGGIASARVSNTDELIALADKALYRAKAEGRNRICGSVELASGVSVDALESSQ
jgi:diguanylate cyclase (GGDEF)-like protein